MGSTTPTSKLTNGDPTIEPAKKHPAIPLFSRPKSALERDDWTVDLPSTEHVSFFRATDWSASLLGPLESWSLALRLQTFTLFADSRSSCIYWGPDKVAIYNEHFAVLAGGAHPYLMGKTFKQGFPELWGDIKDKFDLAEMTGVSEDVMEIPLFTERNGFVEETYFTGLFIPIRDMDGRVGGHYNSTHEVTKQIIAERRSSMFKRLTIPSHLHEGTLSEYVIPFLESNPRDVTMALLYEVDEETSNDCQVFLRGSIGVPVGHEIAVEKANLNSSKGLIPLLREAKSGILTLPVDQTFDGVEWRGFNEPSKHFSILSLSCVGRLFGFLVVGANPRRAVDDDHQQFMRDLAIKISNVAASIVTTEESRLRAERLEKELTDRERQIRFMATNASVGMQQLSVEGDTIWANEQYYQLTGHPRPEEAQYKFSFLDVFHEEDIDKARDSWSRLIGGEPNVSIELRLKRVFVPLSGDPEPACLLALSFPYIEDGKVHSIMTCTTDVSQLKWAESIEARKAADAREAKRQQEEFIDIVSHEMRNPLSAIFQCADMIQLSLAECETKTSPDELFSALQSNADAAATILMCANHQKRIVDDVLTLSKLEYMMLSVSPRPVQPATLVERALRMFDADIKSHDIQVTIDAEPSLEENNVDWVLCDPSRVAQIFINLLTNAIKFTRTEPDRQINIRYGATPSHPRNMFPDNICWAPSQKKLDDLTDGPEWGDGELLYLSLSVTDTGVGMTSEEIKKLFNRFKQASSRTSIKYGGSGLGLFISQKLTEKQGGEIGVSSTGKGSTFVFYVKARRTVPENPSIASQIYRTTKVRSTSISSRSQANRVDLNKIHVLLVEDNLVNQKVLCKQLRNAGCIVHIANHGVEALEFIRETPLWYQQQPECKQLDIILMDWEMPIMDGLTCSREIRALQEAGKIMRHVEILAITANARQEQIQNALDSGIVRFRMGT